MHCIPRGSLEYFRDRSGKPTLLLHCKGTICGNESGKLPVHDQVKAYQRTEVFFGNCRSAPTSNTAPVTDSLFGAKMRDQC
eukprot:2015736-Amphidinium_carterae.2